MLPISIYRKTLNSFNLLSRAMLLWISLAVLSVLSSTDIDDCANQPCRNNGTCTDQVNGFNCSCAPGFYGAQCETGITVTENITNLNISRKYFTWKEQRTRAIRFNFCRERSRRIKSCAVIGYPSGQDGTILPARDYQPRPAGKFSPKAI